MRREGNHKNLRSGQMSVYTGRRWVDPLNKKIGRRTGKDVRAGKNIRVDKYGFENFDDYFSESDAELTRDFSRHQAVKEESESAGTRDCEDDCKENQSSQCNTVSQIMPNSVMSNTTCNNYQSSQTLSMCSAPNTSKFGWLRNRNIGRRTGKNLTANKQIRRDENGFENFDDYLSESDVSSLSSRLSVSAVKPHQRREMINRSYKEDVTKSLNSKTAQRTGTTDESQSSESSQEDQGKSKSESRDQRNSVQTSHYESTSTSDDEKTFTSNTKQKSGLSHSYKSLSQHDDPTDVEEEDIEEVREDSNTKQTSRNQTFQASFVDTPVSSKSSRSYSKVVSEGYYNSKINNNRTQDTSSFKNNSSNHDLTNHSSSNITQGKVKMSVEKNKSKTKINNVTDDGYSNISQGKHKGSIVMDKSLHRNQSNTTDNTVSERYSNNSQREPKMSIAVNELKQGNQSKTLEKNEDSVNDDEDVDSESDNFEEHQDEHEVSDESDDAEEDVEVENDDEYADNDLPEESENVDNSEEESDGDIVKKENATETKVDKNKTNVSKYVEKGHSRKKSDIISVSRNEPEGKMRNGSTYTSEKDFDNEEYDDDHDEDEVDGDHEEEDEEEDDDDELRPSQAPTNIDVAGNKSGSITKLDIPTSVVSFNKTRKRLSYSAGEASEKTIKRNKSRMEEANAELFNVNVSENSKTSKVESNVLRNKDNTEKLNEKSDKNSESRKKATDVVSEENSDFVSLTSRSPFAHTAKAADSIDDEDDDIEILDYNKPKNKSRVERKLSTKDRTKRQSRSSDSESHSDSGKQTELKQLNKMPKTDLKVKKAKGGNKKVIHETEQDLNNTSDLDSNSKSKRKNNKSATDMAENSSSYENNAIDSHTDTNGSSGNEKGEEERSKTQSKLKRKKVLNDTNKSAVVNNLSRNDKMKKRKSQKIAHDKADDIDSKISTSYAENENEPESGNDSVIHKPKSKTNKKLQENTGKSDIKKGKASKNSKLKRNTREIHDVVELSVNNENDCHESEDIDIVSPEQDFKKSTKNVRKKLKENENFKEQTKKGSKRKSSSEDDVEIEMNSKKTKKSKSGRKSRKAKKDVSDDVDMCQDEDVDAGHELQLEDKEKTPKPDTRLSMPTNFGSGVSFRVSRRSEVLENVKSGYIGEVNVEMEPSGGLTPCISRPGAGRKSKGRRVTICPEENIEHNISSGTPSVNSTPLPHYDTTPVHICETTNSSTPCPDPDESVIEDRLIKPSPPEEGLRRSQRTRLKPIAWYKNEQVVFDYRRRSGPAIIGVKPSLEVKWSKLEEEKRRRKKLNYQIRKAAQHGKDKPYRKLSIHREIPPDIELADNSDPEITIYNQNLESEDGIECIGKREAFKPVGPSHETPKREDPYLITKQLNHPCMSAGRLSIKPNAEKPEQLVTADYVVFFIEHGKVLVKIHKTTTLLETGDTFMVPIGNTYSVSNLRNDTAKLFYTIHKQLDNAEENLHETL